MYARKIIETGTAVEIYHNPSHPYTMGLLNSVPRLDEAMKTKLDPIEGLPPDLIDLPPGCSFVPRCRYAYERCSQETPELQAVLDGHESACWRANELAEISGAAKE
jgi:oligopeptide transport system ATP-binding protein